MTTASPAAPPQPLAPAPLLGSPPVHRRLLGADRSAWVQRLVFTAVAVAVIGPLIPIVYQSFSDRPLYQGLGSLSLANFGRLFAEDDFAAVIGNSVYLAALTTGCSLFLALVLAVLLVRVRIPAAGVMQAVLLMPLYISGLVVGFGSISMYGPQGYVSIWIRDLVGSVPWNLYSVPGMAFTQTVVCVPIAYLFVANALRAADTSQEDAARSCGAGALWIIVRVVVPALRPPMFYSALLIFSGSLETLSVPLLYGVPANIDTFGTFLYNNGLSQINPDYGMLGAAAVLMLLVLAALLSTQLIALRQGRRFVSIRGKATAVRRLDLGWLRWPIVALAALYLILGPILPLIGVIGRAFTVTLSPLINPLRVLTLRNFSYLFEYPQYPQSILNSVEIAVGGGVLTTLFMTLVVLVVRRSRFRLRRSLEYLSMAPQAIPGVVISLGLFWALASIPGMGWFRGTILALMLAFAIRAFPAAFGAISPLVMQIGDELDLAARTSGADWLRTVTRILGRLLLPAIAVSCLLLFVEMIQEYTPAVFLASADTGIIGTTMLELWANGQSGQVAALACIQIGITAVFALAVGRLFGTRKIHA